MFKVKSVLDTRVLPVGFNPANGIARLCGPRPVSITALGNLQPQSVVLETGPLGPATVTGSAQLGINADGFWTFRGNVHESGFIGHFYAFGLVLDLLDTAGNAI